MHIIFIHFTFIVFLVFYQILVIKYHIFAIILYTFHLFTYTLIPKCIDIHSLLTLILVDLFFSLSLKPSVTPLEQLAIMSDSQGITITSSCFYYFVFEQLFDSTGVLSNTNLWIFIILTLF